jgi:hypothetical protein
MTPDGQIAIPLDTAAIREPFSVARVWQEVFVRHQTFVTDAANAGREPEQPHHFWVEINGARKLSGMVTRIPPPDSTLMAYAKSRMRIGKVLSKGGR